jgi:hypothetical protein
VPLTADDFVHENSGHTSSLTTSHVISLAGTDATTAGNTVLVFMNGPNATAPAGFVLDKGLATNGFLNVYRKSGVAAGEGQAGVTPWTFTTGVGAAPAWYVVELSNIDPADPLDALPVTAGPTGVANGGTLSSGTTPLNAGLNAVVFAVFTATPTTGSTESWSGYTNGFEEVADITESAVATQLAVARMFTTATGTFSTTATLATTQGGSIVTGALVVVYRAADSPIVTPLGMLAGFEWGTHGGLASHTGTTNMLGSVLVTPGGTWGTNYLIQSGSARNSNYGLRLTGTAAAVFVRFGAPSGPALSIGMDVRVVSATGTVTLAIAGSNALFLLYDSAATKLGVRCGATGTVSWESGTTPLNTWRWVDIRSRVGATTWQAEWRVETDTNTYTDQSPASLGGQSATTFSGNPLILGAVTSQTMTADYDNVVLANYWGSYPLGPHNVKLLTVDPAGTPTVSGTTTNFNVFTANGTLAAWNATNARNAVDEAPPTISASADGVTQTAAAASDYMEFPMATYTLAASETIVGVRMLAVLGSGTGAGAGDIAVRGYDGTTETALASVSQITPGSGTAISTTVPRWLTAMWQSVNGWTQAELDAAAVRIGFSPDATPDMWVHAVYLEVAVGPTTSQQLFGDTTSIESDPNRGGAVSVTMTSPESANTSLYYEEGGSPTTVPVPGGTSVTQQLNASFEADTNYIAAYPDPEGVADT